VLERIEKVDVHMPDSSPVIPIKIVDCGELDRKDYTSVTTENGNAWNCCEIYEHPSKDHKPFCKHIRDDLYILLYHFCHYG
jgi:hypothetical protein